MKNRNCELDPTGLCGTSIDTGGITFGDCEPNLVYIDKVFSYRSDTSCPVLFKLDTRCDSDDFQIKFTSAGADQNQNCCCDCGGCGCCCCCCCCGGSDTPCVLDCDAVFEIDKAFAVLNFIEVNPPGNISPAQVTLDGEEVDSVVFQNGRYLVGISEILPQIQHRQCLEAGLPSKNFLLIKNICAWQIRATYVLEGTVTSGGRTCCFRAEIRNKDNEPPTVLPTNCCSGFAIPNLSIPCPTNGAVPDLLFHFDGRVKLVNPELTVSCRQKPCRGHLSLDGPGISAELFPGGHNPNMNNTPTLVFKSKIALEPQVHVETVRRTLFSLDAREGLLPCENIREELESERRGSTNPCNNLPGSGFKHTNTCKVNSNFGCRTDRRGNDDCGTRGDVCGDFNPCDNNVNVCGNFNPCGSRGNSCRGSNPCRIQDDVCSDNSNPCRMPEDTCGCGGNRVDSCEDICQDVCEIICDRLSDITGGCGCGSNSGCGCGSSSGCGCGCGSGSGCGCGCGSDSGCGSHSGCGCDSSSGCGSNSGCGCGCGSNSGCGPRPNCRGDGCSNERSSGCNWPSARNACQFFGSNGCSW